MSKMPLVCLTVVDQIKMLEVQLQGHMIRAEVTPAWEGGILCVALGVSISEDGENHMDLHVRSIKETTAFGGGGFGTVASAAAHSGGMPFGAG